MKQTRTFRTFRHLRESLLAVLAVAITTIPLFLLGRNTLGEAVIALVYLVPIAWTANRWGQLAGICAALTAALVFDFLFIPPFFTFAVGRLEGWLVLAIFLGVAIFVVERIQASQTKAREMLFMYEMSSAIMNQRTPEGVGYAVARQIQQLFQAALVSVVFHPEKDAPAIVFCTPIDTERTDHPDRIIPIYSSWGLIGEIQIWGGVTVELPSEESRLLQNFAQQTGRAFERVYSPEHGNSVQGMFREAHAK